MLILASASPRRKEILSSMGLTFSVCPADVDERVDGGISPRDAVEILAKRKALAVAKTHPSDAVLGSDTLVALDGTALGKPKDEEDALSMLMALSGKTHHVYTGVAVAYRGRVYADVGDTAVSFLPYTARKAKNYVATGEPMDKAGAYGIQGKGRTLVKSFEGDLDNVVGLPSRLVRVLLDKACLTDKAERVAEALKRLYPDAVCALEAGKDPYKLLVMGRLSAQCTDKRVNEVCRGLFQKYPDAASMAKADPEELAELIRPCGLYRTKAGSLLASAKRLTETYGGILPDTMEELLTFPGVGRKIANLLLGDIFGKPAVVTDTHFIRICGRLGFYPENEKDPYKIEKRMASFLDPAESSDFCHRIVQFGRDVCTARTPFCGGCPLKDICRRQGGE